MENQPAGVYRRRFSDEEREAKARLWRVLVESCLQRFFEADSTVIDIGCGLCEFINALRAGKKYGFDVEVSFRDLAGPDVEFLAAKRGEPVPLPDGICDRAFASNFFEHLKSRDEVTSVLKEAHRVLKPGGRFVVIQPNIALVGGAYWDFFDHLMPLTEKSLLEAMELAGFREVLVKRRFLPYTTKGGVPASPFLLKLYLSVPVFQWLFGQQSLLVVEKTGG